MTHMTHMIDAPTRISSAAYQTTIRRLAGFRLKVSHLLQHISDISSIKVNDTNYTEDVAIKLFADDTDDTFPPENFYHFVSYDRSSCSHYWFTGNFWRFSLSPQHRVTMLVPNLYYMISALRQELFLHHFRFTTKNKNRTVIEITS